MQEKKTLIEREIPIMRLFDCVPAFISYEAKIVLYDLTGSQVFIGAAGDMPLKYANRLVFGVEPYLHIADSGETTAYIKITVMTDDQRRYGTDYQHKMKVMFEAE